VSITILSRIRQIKTIAVGRKIHELGRLERAYGPGRWRKRKGVDRVRAGDGQVFTAEVRWYEASGVGRREFKIERILDE
jgi:hypothetical protein